MAAFSGLFELRKPADLLKKLRHDIERIDSSPFDQFAAFDFFLTAEHIIDWLHPSDETARRALRASHTLLRITSHIANGAKHFEATDKHHRSVSGTEKFRYFEAGYVDPGYVHEPLLIRLTPEEEKEMGVSSIEALTLARQVVEFWAARL